MTKAEIKVLLQRHLETSKQTPILECFIIQSMCKGTFPNLPNSFRNINTYSPMRGRIKGLELAVIPIAVTAMGDIYITL